MHPLLSRWQKIPLYARILGGVILGVLAGLILKERAASLKIPSDLVLRLLGALAPALILFAVIRALIHAELPKGSALRLLYLLLLNTTVAILIGLFVANTLRPGKAIQLKLPEPTQKTQAKPGPLELFLDNIPRSLLGPLTDNGKVIGVVILALALGIAFRRLKQHPLSTPADLVEFAYKVLVVLLHWIIEVIPFAVFGIVASIIGTEGFGPFKALGAFILAVLLGLFLQTCWYLVRIRFGCWAHPLFVLKSMRDALVMAFSTASSTATMPVTFACLRQKVGLRERSATLGALVGSNFNNDGTALYEAMSALFISQLIGQHLGLEAQLMVVLTSIIASVGAAGIPEAGLVTMTLVFKAVNLPTEYIAVLLTVDWFLDRCRTMVNVLGDVNVSCILEGTTPEPKHVEPAARELNQLTDSPPPALQPPTGSPTTPAPQPTSRTGM